MIRFSVEQTTWLTLRVKLTKKEGKRK
jgi:hypothetical protein